MNQVHLERRIVKGVETDKNDNHTRYILEPPAVLGTYNRLWKQRSKFRKENCMSLVIKHFNFDTSCSHS